MLQSKITGIIISICLTALSCKKQEEITQTSNTPKLDSTNTSEKIRIQIQHVAGGLPIGFNQQYRTAAGDSIRIETFVYYLSNIELLYDSSAYLIPESYHLVDDLKQQTKQINHAQLPLGNLKGISFLIGVDAARNSTGAQTGDLDPALGMFWTWTSGYIMAKLEGTYKRTNNPNATYIWHVGGFNPPYTGIRKVQFMFTPKQIKQGDMLNLKVKADVLKWFEGVYLLRIDSLPVFNDPSLFSNQVADNYQNMFTVDSVFITNTP
jgi:hypothetical protein